MNRFIPTLSKALLILGGLLVLGGVGWGIWMRVNAPPPPVISDAGAVVLAMTAPPEPTVVPPSPTPTPTPSATQTPATTGSKPEALLEGSVQATTSESTPTSLPPTPTRSIPTPTPTSTPPPKAEDPPTRIVAPAIDLDASVKPMGWELVDQDGTIVSEWLVPKKAAGWHMNSALPGHEENVVLSGHHNIEGKVFRYVVNLSMGDEVTLYVGDTPYYYKVTDKYILKETGMPTYVRRKNARWIQPTGDERLTLVTCWPYEWPGNSHRVIVVARPLDYQGPKDLVPR